MKHYDWDEVDVLRYVRVNPGVEYWTVATTYARTQRSDKTLSAKDALTKATDLLDRLIARGCLVSSMGHLLLGPDGALDIIQDDERIAREDALRRADEI